MAEVKARMKLRQGTAGTWAALNPVLLAGEPGYETDTKRLRIGDGVTAFTSLPFITVDAAAYQPASAKLTALAALTLAADKLIYAIGTDTLATSDLTTFARTLLAGVDAAAMRTTLGLGDMSTKDDVAISDIDTTGTPSGNTILYGDGVWRQVGRLSYSNVTGSRAINTTYTNSTGRIMSVRIIGVTTIANTDIRIDTSYGAADMLAMGNGLNGIAFSLQADVPPGDTYRLQTYSGGATINVWLEGLL